MKSSTFKLYASVKVGNEVIDNATLATIEGVADNDRMALVVGRHTLTDTVAASLDRVALRESLAAIDAHFFRGELHEDVVTATSRSVSPYDSLRSYDPMDADDTIELVGEWRKGKDYNAQARITRHYIKYGKTGTPRIAGIRVEYVDDANLLVTLDLRAPNGRVTPREYGIMAAFKLMQPNMTRWAENIARGLYARRNERVKCTILLDAVATGESVARS